MHHYNGSLVAQSLKGLIRIEKVPIYETYQFSILFSLYSTLATVEIRAHTTCNFGFGFFFCFSFAIYYFCCFHLNFFLPIYLLGCSFFRVALVVSVYSHYLIKTLDSVTFISPFRMLWVLEFYLSSPFKNHMLKWRPVWFVSLFLCLLYRSPSHSSCGWPRLRLQQWSNLSTDVKIICN